jgi:outer membrane protein assembly factor BamE (lipoprotein component of BamABCDE complex)
LAIAVGAVWLAALSGFGPIIALPLAAVAMLGAIRPRFLFGFPLVMPLLFLALVGRYCEAYCALYPSIDTRYAPGYNEEAFDSILAGGTRDHVRGLLGEPLEIQTEWVPNGTEIWWYTFDGKCTWADWAWLVRTVTFENGRVVAMEKRIAYD